MAFVLPSFEAGELVRGGLRIPSFEAGELVRGGLRIPSLSIGEHALTNDLQIPELEVGDLRDELNMSVGTFGAEADAQIAFYAAASSSASTSASTLAQWVANQTADAPTTITGAVIGGLTMNVVTESTGVFTTTTSSPTIFWEVVTSSATVDGAISGNRLVDAIVTGSVTVNGVVVGSASYSVSAASTAQIIDGIQFVQDFWDGWAFNLNTGAPSFYENFKFNSFARIGANYYGCADTGIFLLGGDTDADTVIDATVTTGYSPLHTEKVQWDGVKHVPTAYVTAYSASPMTLTCRTGGQEYTYTFNAARADMAPARIDIGKGLKGALWQFELKNVAGADFSAESLTALVDHTQRRA